MRQSQLFSRTRKETPKDEISKNAKLLIQGGFIHKEMAGVYSYLPLGLRVLNNIRKIIKEEMDDLGGQEMHMTVLQDGALWQKTDRWDEEKFDAWFKTTLQGKTELGLAATHEEPLTNIMRGHIRSYKDLPVYAYQIQTKFRNEERAKSGILRGREFLMKDLYSFSRSEEELDNFYEKAKQAYLNVFKRAGLGDKTFITFASGGAFSKWSHEFQTLCETGEDTIYVSKKKGIAVNKEVISEEVLRELGLEKSELSEEKSIETGNIFKLGTRFSEPLGLYYTDEAGEKKPVVMGSYGIGLSRLMGAIAEVLSDDKGVIWSKETAPFQIHLLSLSKETKGEDSAEKAAERLYEKLSADGTEVLYDDRLLSAGEKFSDADLLGIPLRAVVSAETEKAGKIEVKERAGGEARLVSEEELLKLL